MAVNIPIFTTFLFNFDALVGGLHVDESLYKKGSQNQGTTSLSSAQSKFGGSSCFFSGSAAAYFTVGYNDMQPGRGDCTLEAWIYRSASGADAIMSCQPNVNSGWLFFVNASDQLVFNIALGAGAVASCVSQTTVPVAQWVHVAATLQGNTMRVFINGVMQTPVIASTLAAFLYTGGLYFGYDQLAPANIFTGYMDSLRVLGTRCLYTASFTPPTTPFSVAGAAVFGGARASWAVRMPYSSQRYFLSTNGRKIGVIPAIISLQPTAVTGRKMGQFLSLDVLNGGPGIISGSVKEAGTPDLAVKRRVRLHSRLSGGAIRDTFSEADGSYSFKWISMQLYYVVSFDHTGNYNAVIKDSITPEKMT
jgi:hypothetical protein